MDYEDQEPLTWQEKMEWARSEQNRLRASRKRAAQDAKALPGIAHLERRLGASVGAGIVKPMPSLLEPLNDAESNARERMLRAQAELLKETYRMTEEDYEARREVLERQKQELLSKDNSA